MKSRLLSILVLVIITTSICSAQDPILWGFTIDGGQYNDGTILNYNITTGIETNKHDFVGSPSDGRYPISSLVKANNGLLYGLTQGGGTNNEGTIFSYNIAMGVETNLHNFGNGTDGAGPRGLLIQASDSLLYGMTQDGGTNNGGILFSYNISTGVETDLHDFGSSADGFAPLGSLIQASNNLIYGVVGSGGAYDGGILFSYNISNDIYTILHDFGYSIDGKTPQGSLIQATNGLLYGMTEQGGTNDTNQAGDGTIFSYNITTSIETVLHDFGSGTDGKSPLYGRLLQANDSLLYGMMGEGGVYGAGIIFNYNIYNDSYTDIHDFGDGTDGKYPLGSLIQASNGWLYGMTQSGGTYGGANGDGIIFNYDISTGTEADIHDFGSGTDGENPLGSFIEVDTVTLSATPAKTTICVGSSVKLVAYGATTYTWSPATGLSATTGDSVIASPTVTTTYTITGTSNIPTYPTTVVVTVNPYPTVSASANPPSYCPGGNAILTASGAATYMWSPATGLSATTDSTVTANPTTTSTYVVTGTSTGGCSAADTITVSVSSAPNKPTVTRNGDVLTSSATQGNQWALNDTAINGATNEIYTVTTTGCYSVIAQNPANGCSTASDTTCVTILSGINQLSVNNEQLAIYPNPTNNSFVIQTNIVRKQLLQVFDITGKLLLSQNIYNNKTTIDASSLANGIYVVSLKSNEGVSTEKLVVVR